MVEKLYSNRHQTGDATFLVESQQIRAHRSVLAALSPKYNAQFYGLNSDDGEIYVPHISAAEFNVFLQFFYKNKVDLTMENIEAVMDLAKQSLVDEFIESCVNFLKSQIKVNKVCISYRLAKLYDIETLRLDCEQRISANTMEFFASDDFLQCDLDMLLHILKMDTLNCKEIDVFGACMAWARAQCKRGSSDDERPENLRKVLGDTIYQIRFSSINAEEFADLHKSMEGFFKPDETIELLYITTKLKDFKSQKFNLTPRASMTQFKSVAQPSQQPSSNEPKEQLPEWSLQCNRFLCLNEHAGKNDASAHSIFSFNCDKPIRLHGMALGIDSTGANLDGLSMNFNAEVRRLVGPMLSYNLKGKVYDIPRKNEIMIIFEKPIERVTHFSCSFESLTLNNKLELKSFVEMNGIKFEFSGKWVICLFFDKL